MEPTRECLRTAFEEVAEAYDRARPTYPAELFDDLAELTGVGAGARVLEIGCGTGQATLPLARRGWGVTCVELGERLAELARAKLRPYPLVEVVHAPFESGEPAEAGFDTYSGHRALDPAIRAALYERIRRRIDGTVRKTYLATMNVARRR